MYFIDCIALVMFVYLLPALACFPRLIRSPVTAFSIPVLSMGVVGIVTTLLLWSGYFQRWAVLGIAISGAGIACWRLYALWKATPWRWSVLDKKIYFYHAILLLPFLIKLGTHGFDRGDEIYSWNFWAIQHVFNEAIDFSHTGAPYPQLFPKLLAFCYLLLGSIELQLPVKAMLIMFPWAMLTACGMVFRRYFIHHGIYYFICLAYVLWGVGLAQFFDDGYADPIMTSALMVSAVLFWMSQTHYTLAARSLVGLAVLSAWVCAYTKQAGLLWAGWGLPVLLWIAAFRYKKQYYFLWGIVAMMGALLWVSSEGREFHHNQGVIGLSFDGRNVLEQLMYSVRRYLIEQPALLVCFGLALYAGVKRPWLCAMIFLFWLPAGIAWFLFGAYQLRLGQHVIAFAFLIILASGVLVKFWPLKLQWQKMLPEILRGSVVVSIAIGGFLFFQEIILKKSGMSLYEGGRQSLHRYFEKDTDALYGRVYDHPEVTLWVPTRYLYGLFYRHTRLVTPMYKNYPRYDAAAVWNDLKQQAPDYVFTVNSAVIDGPASQALSKVIAMCPQAFQKVGTDNNRFNFQTYKVDQTQLREDPCLIASLSGSDSVMIGAG